MWCVCHCLTCVGAVLSLQILTDTPLWHPPVCSVSLPNSDPPATPQHSNNHTRLGCWLPHKAPPARYVLAGGAKCCEVTLRPVSLASVAMLSLTAQLHSHWQTVHCSSADNSHTPAASQARWTALLCCLPTCLTVISPTSSTSSQTHNNNNIAILLFICTHYNQRNIGLDNLYTYVTYLCQEEMTNSNMINCIDSLASNIAI